MNDDARERWRRAAALFDAAVDLGPRERAAMLDAECAGDDALRDEVMRLLVADAGDCALDMGAAAFGSRLGETLRAGVRGLQGGLRGDAGQDDGETLRAVGGRVGPWRLDRVLGRGGMGVVFAAHRDEGGTLQRAAVKRLRRRWDGDGQVRRFLQEQRILAGLSHPNIPRLLDHGIDGERRPWFALELVDGEPLHRHADRARLGLRERIALFREVCAAVQHAHERFVVHRDLKPSNILVDDEGRPRVLDFGAAKRIDDDTDATRTGMFAGFTPEYAAPEQVSGGAITAATDVYALGVVLYELLSGRRPYVLDHGDLRATADAIATMDPTRLDQALATGADGEVAERARARATDLRGYRRFVRGDLSRIVQTALAKEPARRYPSVQALSADLGRFLDGRTVSVAGDTLGYRTRKFVDRNRWSVAMASLATVALLAATATSVRQAQVARREAAAATQMKDYLVEMIRVFDLQNAQSRDGAQRALDAAAGRLRTLQPGSRERLELLALLLELYNDRDLAAAGQALAERELPGPPAWRRDGGDAARLRAFTLAMRLRKETGGTSAARTAMLAALAGYPIASDAARGEALTLVGETWGDEDHREESLAAHLAAVEMLEASVAPGNARLQYARVLAAGALTTLRRGAEGRRMSERALADLVPGDSPAQAYVLTMAALRRALFGDFVSAQGLMDGSAAMLERLGHVRLRSYYVATRAANTYALGRLDEALRDVDARIDDERRALGHGSHQDLAWLLLVRGDVLLGLDRAGEAARSYDDAAFAASDAPLDERYARAMQAVALVQAGRLADARDALPARGDGPATASTAMAMAAAARLAAAEGRHADADRGYRDALAEYAAAAARPANIHYQLREQRDRIRLLCWQALAQVQAGDADGGRDRLRAAAAAARRQLGDAHPVARASRAALAAQGGRIAAH